jgi:DNA polymerase III delta subunit
MITALIGKNNYLLLQNKRRILGEFTAKYGDLAVEQYSFESSELSIRDGLTNLPFLVEKKLVVLDEISSNKTLTESVINLLQGLGDEINVLVIEPSPDKRTAWYKFIIQNSEVINCNELDELGLSKWINDYVKEKGGSITSSASRQLIKRVGLDQRQIVNELQKLLSFNAEITDACVIDLVDPMPQESIFNLLELMILGDVEHTMRLYETLKLSGIDSSEILSMIGWQLHTLASVKSVIGKPGASSGLHPYVVQKNTTVAKKLTNDDLKKLINMTIDAELKIKREGLSSSNVVLVLLHKIIELIQSKNTAV